MNRIRMHRVVPTNTAWDVASLILVKVTRTEEARTNVPTNSKNIPRAGLTPIASCVYPRYVFESIIEGNRSLGVKRASTPPRIWKKRYGTIRSLLNNFAEATASVIAGLITDPECIPKANITSATVPPKVSATRTSASSLEIDSSETTEAGRLTQGHTYRLAATNPKGEIYWHRFELGLKATLSS